MLSCAPMATGTLLRNTVSLVFGALAVFAPTHARAAGEAAEAAESARFEAALAEAISDPAARSDVQISLECQREGRMAAVEVYAHRAVWEQRLQLAVPAASLESILTAFSKARFAAMEPFYGEAEEEGEGPPRFEDHDAAEGVRVACRVTARLGDVVKEVIQSAEGERSKALLRLAERIFTTLEPLTASGIGAADLADGLAKLASGELGAEALSLTFLRKPELSAPPSARGFLLQIAGGTVSVQRFAPATGYVPPVSQALSPAAAADLGASLAAAAPAQLPANLYASEITDLRIRVLDREAVVLARAFTGLAPTAAGEAQVRFDGLVERLTALADGMLGAAATSP